MLPPLQVDLLILKVMSESRVTCDVGYLCTNFSLPRPLGSRLRSDVCDRQTSDRQTSDLHHRLMPPTLGAGHNNHCERVSSHGTLEMSAVHINACLKPFAPLQ